MIPSRDLGDISKLLKNYPNINLVTRDGSNIYKQSIDITNSNIIQVSDRFHLIKGLSETIMQTLREKLPRIITLDETMVNIKQKDLKTRFFNTKKDIDNGMTMSNACEKNNIGFKTFKKLLALNNYELEKRFDDKVFKERLIKIEEKNKIVIEAKKLFNQGLSYTRISEVLNIDRKIAKKYCDESFIFTIENTKKEEYNTCVKYKNKILELLKKGSKIKYIYEEIVKDGYDKKYGSLKNYIRTIKRDNEILCSITVKRKHIISLLYHDIKEIEELNKELLLKIYKKYNISKTLIELMKEFKGIFLKTKKEKALSNWIDKAKRLNIDKISSFIKGIERDYDAIENGLIYNESNGVVEGSVNKIKKIKRVMHGRSSFDLLRKKTLRLEFMNNIN